MRCYSMFRSFGCALLAAFVPVALVAQGGSGTVGECSLEFLRSPRPLNVATYFSWYDSPEEFECMSARPIEGWFDSADTRRMTRHFKRLRRNGFDAIAPVIFADPQSDGAGSRHMRRLLPALEIAGRRGLQSLPLFDMPIAASKRFSLCLPSGQRCTRTETKVTTFNFDEFPELQDFTVDMLTVIADRFILPFTDLKRPERSTARFLTDTQGDLIRDENGRPRPEIYLYLARLWTDNSHYAQVGNVLRRIDHRFAKRGLGKPAYILDVIVPGPKPFEPEVVAAFEDRAVALTSFFATRHRARDLGELARDIHAPMFRKAAALLADLIDHHGFDPRIQIAVGTAPNFDKSRWAACNKNLFNISWPAMEAQDVIDSFLTAFEQTAHPGLPCNATAVSAVPYRNKRIVYAGEGFESTWLCAQTARGGQIRYPNQYGCEPLHIFKNLLGAAGER